jgi:hypothetical protein
MVKRQSTEWDVETRVEAEIVQRTLRLDEDLEIMDRHAADVADLEEQETDSLRRWDREYKNARLHSVPRHMKHVR